jgi:hypothetical protein
LPRDEGLDKDELIDRWTLVGEKYLGAAVGADADLGGRAGCR